MSGELDIAKTVYALENGFEGDHWKQSQSADHYYRPPNNHYVMEIDLIREVLFILQGMESSTFVKRDGYHYEKKFSLFTSSDGILTTLMKEFTGIANDLLKVKAFINDLLLAKQTIIQAFASSIKNEFQQTIKEFSELEYQFIKGGEQKTSMIDLSFIVKQKTKRIYRIKEFLDSHLSGPICGVKILNALYENDDFHQTFIATVKPLLEMIGNCISNGLPNDPFDEFFLEKYFWLNCRKNVENEMDFQECSKIYPEKLPKFLKEYSVSILECYRSYLLFGITHPVHFKSIYNRSQTVPKRNTDLHNWLLYESNAKVETVIAMDFTDFHASFDSILRDSLEPAFQSIAKQVRKFLYKKHNIKETIDSIQQIYFLFSVDMKMIVEKLLLKEPAAWQISNILRDGLQTLINTENMTIEFRDGAGTVFDRFDLLFNVDYANLVSMAS
ncbi:hypothetical protein HDV01_001235 [Terramyces sp. JEL0728]|nr:hypothetical protein HDV01_001235 [Terramyces sp. JEL0728]